jgi:hypothetical protein
VQRRRPHDAVDGEVEAHVIAKERSFAIGRAEPSEPSAESTSVGRNRRLEGAPIADIRAIELEVQETTRAVTPGRHSRLPGGPVSKREPSE